MPRFLDNHFAVLGVYPRSTLAQVVEASEDPVLKAPPHQVSAARSALCNPRTRLAAELSWLPGVAPSRTGEMLYALSGDGDVQAMTAGAPPLARLNIAVAALEGRSRETVSKAKVRLTLIFDLHDQVEAQSLLSDVNADRVVAGLSAAQAGPAFQQALESRWGEIVTDILQYLDHLDADTLLTVVTDITSMRTHDGIGYGGHLLAGVLSKYEIEVIEFLKAEAAKIVELAKAIQANGSKVASHLAPAATRVARMVSRWTSIAQPLAMWRKSQGQTFEPTESLVGQLRLVCLGLYNEHQQWSAVMEMTRALAKASAYFPEWRALLDKDIKFLEQQQPGRGSGSRR